MNKKYRYYGDRLRYHGMIAYVDLVERWPYFFVRIPKVSYEFNATEEYIKRILIEVSEACYA